MKALFAILAAIVLGSALGAGGDALFGAIVGVLALWGSSRIRQLSERIELLERRLAARNAKVEDSIAATVNVAEVTSVAHSNAAAADVAATSPLPPAVAVTAKVVPQPRTASEAAAPVPAAPLSAASPQRKREAPAEGASPAWLDPPVLPQFELFGRIRDWFTGGNTLVRVGVVVLFFGIAFLLRYVAERTELPIEFRLVGIVLGAIALLGLGWRLRRRRAGYALTIQGGAIGILYLTVFAALRLYRLLPASLAFPLLVLITVFATALAVLQDSLALALFSTLGAFLAPIIASSGQGDHVVLFGYYLVLTAGLVAVAWFKAWRPLMLLGFVATFVVASAWGVLRYRPELFGTTEPFLVLFFLAYVAIAVLFALHQAPDLKGYVDGTLVFGPPVVAFGLQSAMLQDDRFRLAFSALAVGGLYIGLAALLWRRRGNSLRLLVESFLVLGVAFLTLAIPLAIDGHWTAATWALEGAALVWVGCRQDRRLPRAAGVLLQAAAGLMFWRALEVPANAWPLLNSGWLGGVMVAVAAAVSALMLQRAHGVLRDYELPFPGVMFVWGLLWWIGSGLLELDRLLSVSTLPAATALLLAGTAGLASELHRRLAMPLGEWPSWLLPPALGLLALWAVGALVHPLAHGGWWGWPLSLALSYALLRRHADEPDSLAASALHTLSGWLLVLLAGTEFAFLVQRFVATGSDWAAWAEIMPAVLVLFALPAACRWWPWPVGRHEQAYIAYMAGGIALYLGLWLLGVQLRAGDNAAPLPFVPLLNPIDLASGLVLFALLRYWTVLRTRAPERVAGWSPRIVYGTLAALAFVWLNGALLRAVHHFGKVPYQLDRLLASTLTQVSLSIFWALLALGAMLFATRRASRVVWLVGAALLAVVVAKLFLVDLSRVGSIERIISFVGVGGLMLVIGYFSPLPPVAAVPAAALQPGAAGDS